MLSASSVRDLFPLTTHVIEVAGQVLRDGVLYLSASGWKYALVLVVFWYLVALAVRFLVGRLSAKVPESF